MSFCITDSARSSECLANLPIAKAADCCIAGTECINSGLKVQ